MEINIHEYLDHAEIEADVRYAVQQQLEKHVTTYIKSAVDKAVADNLNRLLEADGELRDHMNDAIGNAINEMSFFGLFSNYRGEKSLAYELLEQAVAAQQNNIEHKVRDVVNEIGFSSVEDLVVQAVSNMFWENRPKEEQ